MGIDDNGLWSTDRKIIDLLIAARRPLGLEAIAHALRLDPATLRTVYEPYLTERGYLVRGPRGRQATAKARREYAA